MTTYGEDKPDTEAREKIKADLHEHLHEACADGHVFGVDVPSEHVWDFVGILADVRLAMGPVHLRVYLTPRNDETIICRFTAHPESDSCEGAAVEVHDCR